MNKNEFKLFINANGIELERIVVGYVAYIVTTTSTTFEYQSFIFYDMLTNALTQYDVKREDLARYIKKKDKVLSIKTKEVVTLVEIKTNRWFGLDDKYAIKDADMFLEYNGLGDKN